MGFAKLDEQILDSTLWAGHTETRVFLAALVLARPWVFDEPMLQLEVRGMETTGVVIPPGWYGFIQSSGIGIIRRAQVDEEKGYLALEALGSPDIESRSSAFDGRRLVRIDGGFVVLNYMKWRDRDDTAADRAQRYRDRKKQRSDATGRKHSSRRDVTPVTRDATVTSRDVTVAGRDVTQAEAEAEAEAKAEAKAQSPHGCAQSPHGLGRAQAQKRANVNGSGGKLVVATPVVAPEPKPPRQPRRTKAQVEADAKADARRLKKNANARNLRAFNKEREDTPY